MSKSKAGQLAADALEWAASGKARPPASIAKLSTSDQAKLAQAAAEVARAAKR